MAGEATLVTVQSLYLAYYGRPADPEGLNFWANVVEANGGDINVIIKDFSTAPEYQQRFGSLDNPTLVNNLYLQMFGRNAEPDGLAFWVGQITSGSQTLGQVASTISSLASGIDLQVLSARVELANAFTAQLNTTEKLEAYASTRGIEIGRSYLDQVKSTNVGDVAAIVAKAAETAATLPPTTDGGNTGGGVVTPPAATFIKDASSTLTALVLSGTATGTVTVSVDTTTEAVSITRAGITQTLTKVQYDALSSVAVNGTGVSISVTGAQSIAFLTKLTAPNATVTYDIADSVGNIVNSSDVVNALVVSGANVTVTGTATAAKILLIDVQNGTGTLTYALADTYVDLKASDVLTVVAKASSVVVTDQVDIAKLVEIEGLATVASTVHGLSIEDDIANLITGRTPRDYITTGTDISVTGTATVAQIADLDTANGNGDLSYSLKDTYANLKAAGTVVGDASAITVSDSVNIAKLDEIQSLNADATVHGLIIQDAIASLLDVNGARAYITVGTNITVTDSATLAQIKTLDLANDTSTLTYTLEDTLAVLSVNTTEVNGLLAGASSVIVTDNVAIIDLMNVADYGGNATEVVGKNITDVATNLVYGTEYITTGSNITVSYLITVADIKLIDAANGDGTLTFNLIDTSIALLTDTPEVRALVAAAASVTVSNVVSIETLDEVAALVGTDVVVSAQNITDDIGKLISNTDGVSSYITAGSNVVVNGGATAEQIDALNQANGSGSLSFNLQDTYLALTASTLLSAATEVIVYDSVDVVKLNEIKSLAPNAYKVTGLLITDDVATLLGATEFFTIGTEITVSDAATVNQIGDLEDANGVDGSIIYVLEDTYSALKGDTAAIVSGATTVTVSDSVNITKLDEIKALATDADVLGKIIVDGVAKLLTGSTPSAYITEGTNITLIGGATAQQIADLDAANGAGTVAYALEDTSTVLLSDTTAINTAINAASLVTVSDTVDIAKLNDVKAQVALVDATTPAPVYGKNITDTVAHLISGTTPNPFITTGTNITMTGSATAAQLAILDTANGTDSATTGTLTYALKDTSTVLLSDTLEINAAIATATSVTVTDNVSVLTLMGVKNLAGADTAVYGENITDVITNLVDGTTGNAIGLITIGTNITVTDATTVAKITALDTANGSGTLSYALTDISTALLANTTAVDALVNTATSVTVTNDVTISVLNSVKELAGTDIVVTAQNVADIADTLITGIAYITAGTNVSVTDGATVAQIALLDAANGDNAASGTLTYAIEDSIANLINTPDPVVNAYVNNIDNANVTVTGHATVAEIDLLNAAKGTGTLSYSLRDTNAILLDADNTSVLAGATSIVLESNTLGTVTVEQVKALLALGTNLYADGGVTLLILSQLTFNLEDTSEALATSTDASIVAKATGVTANDIATVAQATAIYTANDTAVYDITDTVANLVGTSTNVANAVTQANDVIATGVAATAAEATIIHVRAGTNTGLTTTTYNVSDTYANLDANLPAARAAVDLTVEFNSYPYFLTPTEATNIIGLTNTGLTTIPSIVGTAGAMNTFIAANNWDNTLHYSFAVQDTADGIIAAIGNTTFITGATATGLGTHSVDSVTVTSALTIAQSKTFWEAFTGANVGTTKSLTYYEVTDTIANFTNANTATNWVKDADVKTVTGTAAEIQAAQSPSETNLNNIFSQLTSSDHIVTTGSDGAQTLQGSIGNDTLRGGAGADTLNGGEGNDTLDGGDDNDTIHGNNGDDTIYGGAGNNVLYGDAGRDTIYAGASAAATSSTNGTGNIVYGGAGSDNLFGSAINDTFKFAGATAAQLIAESGTEQDARDYITNFSTGDKITFENVASIKSFGTGTGIATSVTAGTLALAVSYEKNVDAGQWSGSTTALSTRVSIDIANAQGVFDGQADMTIILVGNIDISVSGTNSLIFGG